MGKRILIFTLWIAFLTQSFGAPKKREEDKGTRHYNVPMHEVIQNELYIGLTNFGEYAVTYAGKGADMRPDDYITHADNIKLLTGTLQEFLDSGVRETVVPIVDDEDVKYGGQRLLGFVMIQSVMPRKMALRRGEIEYDMEEGGPPPMLTVGNIMISQSGELLTNAEDYVPPPNGGGKCITSKDCYNFNGTCSFQGECVCRNNQTGSYCQLFKSEKVGLSGLAEQQKLKNSINSGAFSLKRETVVVNPDLPKPPPDQNTFVNVETEHAEPIRLKKVSASGGITEETGGEEFSQGAGGEGTGGQQLEDSNGGVGPKGKAVRKKKPGNKHSKQDGGSDQGTTRPPAEPKRGAKGADKNTEQDLKTLYGPDGVYPEPYLAGKIPGNMAHERARQRKELPKSFLYSIRFRTGPIGVAFDNNQNAASIVEAVMPNMQAHLSDVQKGDRLIAINEVNTTTAPPKITTKILQSLPWPIVLVFETAPPEVDKKKLEAISASTRTLNVTVLYPPTFTGEMEARLADWTPSVDIFHEDSCTFYSIQTPKDQFGCEVSEGSYALSAASDEIIRSKGKVSMDLERSSPMQVLLAREAEKRGLQVKVKSLSLLKRGTCTFVQKAKLLGTGNASIGIVVNTEDKIIDLPAGKENTTQCTVPFSIIKQSDGELLQLAALQSEVLAVVSDPKYGQSPSCTRLITMAEDILDRWAHSIPHVSVDTVMAARAPDKGDMRGTVDEGGRLAVSGKNGWAFFDYHLALFGPEEVPLGPHRLQMAVPPHGMCILTFFRDNNFDFNVWCGRLSGGFLLGCDPNSYQVRITGTIVAILRGGGCSFGIKVINAQKMGAKVCHMLLSHLLVLMCSYRANRGLLLLIQTTSPRCD